jgi:hypothetical protein
VTPPPLLLPPPPLLLPLPLPPAGPPPPVPSHTVLHGLDEHLSGGQYWHIADVVQYPQ